MAAYADTGGTTNPIVSGATFADNFSSSYGGGAAISTAGAASASPSFTNVTFTGNFGGVAGGAVVLFTGDAGSSNTAILTNITSSGNTVSSLGGALYLYEGGDLTAATVTNSILWDGSAGSGTELYVDNTASADVSYSVVDGGCANPSVSGPGSAACSNVLSGDPNLAALGDYGGKTQTMPLLAGSSALNTGTNTGCPAADQRGVKRPQMGTCDIGATETRRKKSTFKSKGGQDGWVLESGQGTGIGGSLNSTATTLRVGDDAQDRLYRSVVSFDTTSVPDWFIPDAATLKLRSAGIAGASPAATLGAIRADCQLGYLGAGAALEAGDFEDVPDAYGVVSMGPAPVNGWFSETMAPAGLLCLDPTGVTQLRLGATFNASDMDGVADYFKLSSGNADSTLRPKLILKYYIP